MEQQPKPRRDLRELQPWPEGMKPFEDALHVEPFSVLKLCPAIENISYTGNSSLELVQSRLEW